MYRTDVYFLCKTMAEVPIFLAIPCIFTCVMYYMVGLNPKFSHFLAAGAIITLVSNVATSFGEPNQIIKVQKSFQSYLLLEQNRMIFHLNSAMHSKNALTPLQSLSICFQQNAF